MPVASHDVISALHAVASPALRSWAVEHSGAIAAAIQRGLSNVQGRVAAKAPMSTVGAMSLQEAIAWALRQAESMLGATVIEQGQMIQDDVGASYSSLGPLRSYAGMPEDAPLIVHLSGMQALRHHKGTQIDPQQWNAAWKAMRAAWEAQNPEPPPEWTEKDHVRIFNLEASAASGLQDGSKYQWDKARGQVRMRLAIRHGIRVNDLLAQANIPRSAYSWVAGPGETYKRWLVADVDWVGRIANAIKEHYPELAAALLQNDPMWRVAAGRTAHAVVGPPTAQVDVANIDPHEGAIEGLRWMHPEDAAEVGFNFPMRMKLAVRGRWVMGKDGKTWWYVVPIVALPDAAKELGATRPIWGTVVQQLAAMLAPEPNTCEKGSAVDGSWELKGATYALQLAYKADAQGWHRSAPVRWDAASKSWLAPAQALPKVLPVVAQHWPAVAGALAEVCGLSTESANLEAASREQQEREIALREMSGAKAPNEVHTAQGRAVLDDVVRKLKVRLPQKWQLFPYQLVGVAFAKLAGYRALIGDAMGLGKTAQALAAIAVDPEQLLPAVVVAPASVVLNWKQEVKRWLPSVPVHVLHSKASALPAKGWKGIVIVSWGLIASVADVLVTWGAKLLVADECHYAKEASAARSKAVAEAAHAVPHVFMLSGTPLKNRAIELWHVLYMLDPVRWRSRSAFGHQYTHVNEMNIRGKTITKFEGGRNLDALRAELRTVMVRRLKEDVLTDLPPKTRTYLPVEMSPADAAAYRRAEDNFASWLKASAEDKLAEVARELAKDPTLASEETAKTILEAAKERSQASIDRALRAAQLVKIGYLRRLVGTAKINATLEQIAIMLEADEPVVVFAEHHNVVQGICAGLKAAGVPYSLIDGSTPKAQRQATKEDFQAGKTNVFVGSQAAKEGITLVRSANTIFAEYWWTPGDMDQAEDRIHRIGQTRAAMIWYIHADDTIDDDMQATLAAKHGVIDGAIGDTTVASTTGDLGTMANFMSSLARRRKNRGSAPRERNTRTIEISPAQGMPTPVDMPPIANIHAVLFDANVWNQGTAKQWLRMSGVPVNNVVTGARSVRATVNQARTFRASTLRQLKLRDDITVVVGSK